MNIEKARFNMIEQQIRTWDVLDPAVLETLVEVKREAFVPAAYKSLAFVDTEIPLPGGENMFSPKMEARILQEVAPRKDEDVLEIGAGSGYMAALLASKARHVTTVEIDPALRDLAAKNLSGYGVTNVDVVQGDGARGWNDPGRQTPWDVIVISGSLPLLPEAFLKQIKVGGRVFSIIGTSPVMSAQITTRVGENAWDTVKIFETDVKPLRNAQAPSRFSF
ncbi:MAG TPA: protein-L-isoaspartate O-methyltransferase [Noviherbaspirillum sp.]|nr:protein-L-isoaspartate O-methyltransferase [Noviherbaspirillum sp.]